MSHFPFPCLFLSPYTYCLMSVATLSFSPRLYPSPVSRILMPVAIKIVFPAFPSLTPPPVSPLAMSIGSATSSPTPSCRFPPCCVRHQRHLIPLAFASAARRTGWPAAQASCRPCCVEVPSAAPLLCIFIDNHGSFFPFHNRLSPISFYCSVGRVALCVAALWCFSVCACF